MAAATVVAATAVVAVFAVRRGPTQVAVVAEAAAPLAVTPPAGSPPVRAPFESPRAAALPIGAASAAPALDDGRVEICGLGRVNEKELEQRLPRQVVLDARQRVADALLQGSAREQMVGHLMHVLLLDHRLRWPSLEACAGDVDCQLAAHRQSIPQQEQSWLSMVDLAVSSSDPWLYAAAVNYACRGLGPGDFRSLSTQCRRLSAQAWARSDPDNAAPWFVLAAQADAKGDAAAAEAALRRAAASTRHDPGYASVHGPLLVRPEFRALPPAIRMQVTTDLWGVTAAIPTPFLQQVTQRCRPEALAAPGRRETCQGLARLFIGDRSTMLDFFIGVRIAGWLDWPAAELMRLDEEKLALGVAQVALVTGPVPMFSCTGIEQRERFDRDIAEAGEAEAARRLIKAGGESIAKLAQQERMRRASMERESAASVPR